MVGECYPGDKSIEKFRGSNYTTGVEIVMCLRSKAFEMEAALSHPFIADYLSTFPENQWSDVITVNAPNSPEYIPIRRN